jgi:hypothetical protein
MFFFCFFGGPAASHARRQSSSDSDDELSVTAPLQTAKHSPTYSPTYRRTSRLSDSPQFPMADGRWSPPSLRNQSAHDIGIAPRADSPIEPTAALNTAGDSVSHLMSQIAELQRDRSALQAQVEELSSRSVTVSQPITSPTAASASHV